MTRKFCPMAWYCVLMSEVKVTPEVRAQVLAWERERRRIGTQGEWAKRLKVSVGSIERILWQARCEEKAKCT